MGMGWCDGEEDGESSGVGFVEIFEIFTIPYNTFIARGHLRQ